MQTTQNILDTQLDELIDAIYAEGTPVVNEAYSGMDVRTLTFLSAVDLRANILFVPNQRAFFHYALYYPNAKGFIQEKRIELKPEKCNGHTHRFSQEGWGLIFLQITLASHSHIQCCVGANSSIRARTWSTTYPELKSPDLWDWTVVGRYVGRLVRLVRKLGKQAEQLAKCDTEKSNPK